MPSAGGFQLLNRADHHLWLLMAGLLPDLGRQSSFVFYFRINGRFGKGQIFDISPSGQEGARLTANLNVWLQPDGSRNLESMQCWW